MLILIVDDELSLCHLMAEVLGERFKTIEACNGKQALELFRQQQPALVVSDIMMPEINGIELLETIKQESPQTPVILLTAGSTRIIPRKADAFLKKPFDLDELENAVDEVLQSRFTARFNEDSVEKSA